MIQFKNLKKTILDFEDKIPSGKFRDCRICDIIQDDYDYLIWCQRNNMLQLSKPVIAKIHQLAAFAENEEYFDNEVAPYLAEDYLKTQTGFEDVPF